MGLWRSAALSVAVVASLAAGSALASDRPVLVVMDLEARGSTPLQAEAATSSVVRGLRNLDVFQILSASDVRQLLAIERSRQLLGGSADGSHNMSEVSRALG